MVQLLTSFFTILHVMFRGDSTVVTTVSPLDYTYKHTLTLENGIKRNIVFRCKQHKHQVFYKHWFIPDRCYYTYGVEMLSIDDDEYTDYHVAHYPHMCMKLLVNTTFPYRCAVNAHLDVLNKHNSP